MGHMFKTLFLFLISIFIPFIGAFLVVHYFDKCYKLEMEKKFNETL